MNKKLTGCELFKNLSENEIGGLLSAIIHQTKKYTSLKDQFDVQNRKQRQFNTSASREINTWTRYNRNANFYASGNTGDSEDVISFGTGADQLSNNSWEYLSSLFATGTGANS